MADTNQVISFDSIIKQYLNNNFINRILTLKENMLNINLVKKIICNFNNLIIRNIIIKSNTLYYVKDLMREKITVYVSLKENTKIEELNENMKY